MNPFPCLRIALVSSLCVLALNACRRDNEVASIYRGFPVEVGEILKRDCATPGCHDAKSFAAEGRFSAESWEELFQGSSAGSVLIPYRADQSYMLYFTNVDKELGLVQEPLMPLNGDPISRADYLVLRDWINAGAPNIHGDVMFTGVKDKIYILNQGCDLLGVMDAKTRLLMRYVDVGMVDGFIESPHMMKLSPDGQYLYIVFLASPNIEVYSTKDDSFVKRIHITDGDWNTINLSPDGKYAFCVAYAAREVAIANLETGETDTLEFSSNAIHGAAVNGAFNRLYLTHQDESALFRIDFSDPMDQATFELEIVDLVQGVPPALGGYLKPHEIAFTPDGSKFLVSCQGAGEVRVYDAATELLLEVIPVGHDPVEIAFSAPDHLAFVTCMNDTVTWAGDPTKMGSVAVINYLSNTHVSTVYPGFQPHGISIDPVSRLAFVSNRNASVDGPAPHHSSDCDGRNGYLTAIDLNTLTVLPWKAEMSVDPYSVVVKR